MKTVVTPGMTTTLLVRDGIRASAGAKPIVRRIHTMRGVQVHRGYVGYVTVEGQGSRECGCNLHQKRKAAREHAVREARAELKLLRP